MRIKKITMSTFIICLLLVPAAMATNGTNLIGIGPISRAMGGGGVAAPQDAVSAIFANPAAMCFGPYCPGSSVDFAGTLFNPTVNGKITVANPGPPPPDSFVFEGESQLNPFIVPAVGITTPISERWRFGIGMFGVSGLGADYKGTDIYPGPDPAPGTGFPIYTQLQTMKFAPNIAWLVTNSLSLGLSLEVVWQNLDLGIGSSHGYALGAQLGILYNIGKFNIGASYTTPESVNHKNVADLDGDGTFDDLKIASPQTVKLGVAFQPSTRWLFELNTKWYDWANADGYGDFDWESQWVFTIGGQWRPLDRWAFRLGYNYGKTPLKDNSGFNPDPTDPTNTVDVQGTPVSRPEFEALRVVGFPALAEHHITGGLGYNITDNIILNLSAMVSPEEKFTENSAGNAFNLESTLSEWSTTFGLTWNF